MKKDTFKKYCESYELKNIELAKKRFNNDIKNIIEKDCVLSALSKYGKMFKNDLTVSFISVKSNGINLDHLLKGLDMIRDNVSLYSETSGLNSISISGKLVVNHVERLACERFCAINDI